MKYLAIFVLFVVQVVLANDILKAPKVDEPCPSDLCYEPSACGVNLFIMEQLELDFPEEIWKDISGYEGLYQCSNLGRLKALRKQSWHNLAKRMVWRKERYLKLKGTSGGGYLRVNLSKNGINNTYASHRMIAMAFIQNPLNKRCVNHKNGIKTDNRVYNLEWCTHSENSKHSFKIGTQCNKGENHPQAKLTMKIVNEIRDKYIPRVYPSRRLAREYNLSKRHILDIIHYKVWNYGFG